MDNIAMWQGILGFAMPLLISVIVQTGWDDRAKSVCAFVCCVIGAVGTAALSGQLDGVDVVTGFLIVFTLAMASYKGFWKPLGIAPALTAATTLR